jgi:hypothetical protein
MTFTCLTVAVIVVLCVVLYAARCDDRMGQKIEEGYNNER